MHAHSADLRAEIADLPEAEREALVAALQRNWREADLAPEDRALCSYAEKLATDPASMSEADVLALRRADFDDVAIHDAIQVVAYFSYINRVADAVHVDLEAEMPPDLRAGRS